MQSNVRLLLGAIVLAAAACGSESGDEAPVVDTFPLMVVTTGTGTGTITSSPAGIDCGADCVESYAHSTSVTLTATPDPGAFFAGWSGGGCAGTGTCTVTVTSATAVSAAFALDNLTLTVTRAGTGTGSVTSSPAGISCGADCTEAYPNGAMVTLTATPDAGAYFAGWSGGGCAATTSTCTLSMTAARSVTATFNLFVRIGHTADLGESSSHGPNFLLGEKLVVSAPCTLLEMGVLVRTAGPHMVLALYTDVGGAPGALVAQTASTVMTAGTMEVPITAGSVDLAAGTYWIVGVYDSLASIGYTSTATGNLVAYRSMTFGSPLPNPFGTATTYTGQSLNYWIVVR